MPLVRISLLKGRSGPEIRVIADSVHESLVEAFEVPTDDRFQIIEQREAGELIFSTNYLGIERTDACVMIQIIASNWRSVDAKQKLYKAMAERLAANAGLRREDVQVILTPNAPIDWSFGNGVASYPPSADA